jgi:alkyl hydroperoxide reductase subunit AhpF
VTSNQALGEREQDAIRSVLAGLERDVDVTLELGPTATPVTLLAAGGREIDTGDVTRDLVDAVCALSDRVSLSLVEHDEPGRWPRTTIGAGLEYLGMPMGYELTTLVHGILEAGRLQPSLGAASRERLAAVDDDLTVDVYVTPT